MITTQQKISGTFQTFRGAQVFGRIRGYISTLKQPGYNVPQGLQSAIEGVFRIELA